VGLILHFALEYFLGYGREFLPARGSLDHSADSLQELFQGVNLRFATATHV
jgi:hypothetical protein